MPDSFRTGFVDNPQQKTPETRLLQENPLLRTRSGFVIRYWQSVARHTTGGKLTVHVVMPVHQIRGLEQLVQVDKGSNNDQAAQNIPEPEVGRAEAVCNTASDQLIADTVGNFVIPNDGADAKGDGGNDKQQQAEMHGLFAVISGSDNVNVVGNRRHNDQGIDTKCDQGEQNGFEQSFIGFQLTNGGSACIVFHNQRSS